MGLMRSLLLLVVSACTITRYAQAQDAFALRLTPVQLDAVATHTTGELPLTTALVLDHNLGSHLAMAFEAGIFWCNITDPADPADIHVTYDLSTTDYLSWKAYYIQRLYSWHLLYHTAFFFNGNKDASFYLGSFLGTRWLRNTLAVLSDVPTSYGPDVPANSPFSTLYKAQQVVFPVGLRIGYRSPLKGFSYDAFLNLGYQFGPHGDFFSRPELQGVNQIAASHFTLMVGYSMGIGW